MQTYQRGGRIRDMAIVPGDGRTGDRCTRFVYTDAYETEREAYGILLAVNRRESNREGIVMFMDETGTQRMCMVRENDAGVAAWVRWVDQLPAENEGWTVIRTPVRTAAAQEGWSGVLAWVVLAGVVACVLYGTGNL